MNKRNIFFLIHSKNQHIVEIIIFCFFSILIPLINNQYSFNPFLLVLIFLAYNRGINTYLFTIAITVLTSFIISSSYGIELLLIHLFFFLFCLLLCLVKKDGFLKRYGPFFLTHFLFIGFYLSRNFSFESVLNMGISLIASSILLYGYSRFSKCLFEPHIEFESKAKVIVLSTFSVIFYGISGFYVLIARFFHILICKSVSPVEGALAIIINCFFLYYLQDASYVRLLTLIIPSLIAVFLNKKIVWISYLISYLFVSVYLIDSFYSSVFFYQGLAGILLALIFPSKWLIKLTELFEREESKKLLEANTKLKQTSESVANIIQYLDVVLDASIDTRTIPSDKALSIIQEKVCATCEKRGRCHLFSTIRKGLEEELSKEEKTLLFEECFYPYKIIRQIRLNKQTLNNEKKYLDEIHQKNEIYKKEIENIYTPLRNVFVQSELLMHRKTHLIEELESYHYHVSELSLGEDSISFQIALEHKEDITKVMVIIANNMKKTYYLEDMFYILSLGLYQVTIASKPLYKIEEAAISYGVNDDYNGDTYLSFVENNHFFLMLSDGIGHHKTSSFLSFFMVNALNSYRKIENKIEHQIANINALLKSKIDEEMYATLDYIDIDLIKGDMEIFKCGSFHSYLYSKGQLIQFKSNTPPLGILYDIKTNSLTKELNSQDILIFMSDGYMQEPEEIIEEVLKENFYQSSDNICNLLNKKLSDKSICEDDKTLIVLKFVTAKAFVKEGR